MGAAYSIDLRKKIVDAYDRGEGSMVTLATRFSVSGGFVRDLLNRRRDFGTISPKPYAGGKKSKLSQEHLDWIISLYEKEENIEHQVACDRLEAKFGIKIGNRWMCKVVKRLGISRKKRASLIPREIKSDGQTK